MKIKENKNIKIVKSENYNYIFNKQTGFFARWGKNKNDDPIMSPAPEILDLEISSGKCMKSCSFCYKENSKNKKQEHMSFETFKNIFNKMPRILTQIAFGLTDTFSNPDFIKMLEYCRNNKIIPNLTSHGLDITEENSKILAKYCGAIAISYSNNKKRIYESINHLYNAGLKQINIHYVLAEETVKEVFNVIDDLIKSKVKINAIVFLQYKPKGKGNWHSPTLQNFKNIIEYCNEKEINYGFDSCSAPLAFKSVEGTKQQKDMELYGEPCESSLFSSYINHKGEFFPCSFAEGVQGWEEGINVLKVKNFDEIWNNEKVKHFRKYLLNSSKNCDCVFSAICRSCPIYNIGECKK